ncbi:GTP 3',8-cyclase MoaA [Helicobacter bizzozeronii]|uniref:GTP 3',8-cyclase MoaA n=1 Tax=Helicobacter bizzozeronii TaxID=56877 RepID=UPI000CF01E9D|nr:GTP 3',8-cyclase MoaA [Helicobacter bizzozeronii]
MLIDTFDRRVDYLRVSVTKQCNFRCQYCMPTTPMDFFDREELLPLDKMLEFIKIAIDEGIQKIRITGGEPLIRKDLAPFIAKIHAYAPHVKLALTTNGFLLKNQAQALKEAGLERVNVSLDSLKPERVAKISQKDGLKAVLEGIDEALKVGLGLKFNMVVLQGINGDEILELLEFARGKNAQIRYIEFMENTHANSQLKGLSEAQILGVIQAKYPHVRLISEGVSPSKIYALEDGYEFGIIAPHNDDFCKHCNKIRLSADGTIFPCLYYQDSVNAKEAILKGTPSQMRQALHQSVQNKPEKNLWQQGTQNQVSSRAFYKTGG